MALGFEMAVRAIKEGIKIKQTNWFSDNYLYWNVDKKTFFKSNKYSEDDDEGEDIVYNRDMMDWHEQNWVEYIESTQKLGFKDE